MKQGVIGAISGLVIGVAIGASVVAPRLNGGETAAPAPSLKLGTGIEILPSPANIAVRIAPLARPEPAPQAPPPEKNAPEPAPKPTPGPDTVTPVVFRMESAFAPAEAHARGQGERIARVASEISGGGLQMETFGPGQIVAPEDLFSAVASGAVDAAFATPGFWAERIPALTLFGALPFGPAPDEHLAWFFSGGGKDIYDAIYAKNGLKGLLCGIAPAPSSGWFTRPIDTPDDFQAMRIHARETAARVFERLGVTTYNLDQAAALEALDGKTIDGAVLSAPTVDLASGAGNAAAHYYFPGWQQPTRFLDLIINKDRWDGLTDRQRAQMEAACGDNLRFGLAAADSGQFAALMEIAEAGVEIHRWPDPVIAALRQAWAEVRAELASGDKAFREGWTSLDRFREDQAIWRELAHP